MAEETTPVPATPGATVVDVCDYLLVILKGFSLFCVVGYFPLIISPDLLLS